MPSSSVHVLVLTSDSRDAEQLRAMLTQTAADLFELSSVGQLGEALDRLRDERFDVILMGLRLPDASDVEALARVRLVAGSLPIVVLIGPDDEALALQAIRAGAQDYVLMGRDDGYLVARSLRYAIERKLVEERLTRLAYYDSLTDLPNRDLLRDQLKGALARAARNEQMVAFLLVGLDRFKAINDTLGRDAGDGLLKTVAERLRRALRAADTIARFESDTFALVLEGLRRFPDAETDMPWPEASVARRCLDSLGAPFGVGDREVFVTGSIGIALYPRDAEDESELIRSAEKAMRHAKAQGGNTYRYYTSVMNQQLVERLALESSLRHAVERREFLLHYQPQVDLRTGTILGVEALLRWQHPERGFVSPAEFIPIAEESGLIVPIGEWVLREACAQNHTWQVEGLPRLRVSVNVSACQFRQGGLVHTVARTLKQTGLDPQYLELEVTESVLMQNTQVSRALLSQLRDMDVRLAIDDFGTGYSSLGYLKRFPVHALKIDRSFVADMTADPDAAAIVTAIITLAHSLRLLVVAEGAETEEQLAFLRAHDCDAMQGYLFCRPVAPEAIVALLREERPFAPPAPQSGRPPQ